jgi:flagellar hook protein FlgE
MLAFSPTTIIIDPQGGVGTNIQIIVDPGSVNQTDGLVCFDSPSSARAINPDGYTSGELEGIAINESGIITGNFTNGQNQTLAQLAIALFDNPAGLRKVGENVFIETLNSGSPTEAAASTGGRGIIIPSALEGSNVDLASEFVNLITAQRGYQTNARMITASDRMLQELVNLVR